MVLWRLHVRDRDKTPPFDAHEPVEIRALSEASALDRIANYAPYLEVLTDASGNPLIERRPTP